MALQLSWPRSSEPLGGTSAGSLSPPTAGRSGESLLEVLAGRVESLEDQVRLLAETVTVLTDELDRRAAALPEKSMPRARAANGAARNGGTRSADRTSRVPGSKRASTTQTRTA